jgi:carbamoyltransferase
VLNTSFNDNEPIVCKPQEAIDCFARTQMDALVLGDFLITREDASGQQRSAITATAEQD